jgi:hypothetical protein
VENSATLDQTLAYLKSQPVHPREAVAIREPIRTSWHLTTCSDIARAESFLQLESFFGSLLVWFGPTFARRTFQRNGNEEIRKNRTGYGFGIYIIMPVFPGKHWRVIDISLTTCTALSQRISIQWNLHLPCIVSEDSDIFHYTKTGNIQAVEFILASRKGSPSDTTPNGLTLLHVSSITHDP